MKRLTSIVACIAMLFNLCSCKNIYIHECIPSNQTCTYWMSEDGTISFYVHSYSRTLGKITVGEEELEVQFWWLPGGTLEIYSLDFLRDTDNSFSDEPEPYLWEEWTCVFLGKDMFIATIENTTYFEEGERIVFKKADVGDNEIVYLD